jgi:alpha-methylacyl-CoA racemase
VGPLAGVSIVEFASLAPAPFGVMVLADLGADVVRIDRVSAAGSPAVLPDPLGRSRRSVAVDLKHPDGRAVALRLVERADVAVEGWRPGVAERLGVGPDACFERNPRLVYGRMTGWGQDGPLAGDAGHDIDYLAVAGALEPIGRAGGPPVPPLNLVGDFGGGGMLLAVGILAALLERERSGRGQVVDAAMVEGAALLTTMLHGFRAAGLWEGRRGENLLDSGAPFYDVYEAADGRYVAVGAIEPQFFAALLHGLGIDPAAVPAQHDRRGWPLLRERLAAAFRTRARDEWAAHFAGRDACVAPVLDPGEAPAHPHLRARESFVEVGGTPVPGPAPRFGRTPSDRPRPAPYPGEHTDEVLGEAGYGDGAIRSLRAAGAVA